MCNKVHVKGVRRMVKRALKEFEDVTAVLNRAECEDKVHTDMHFFFALLATAPLSHTYRSRCRLYTE